MFQGVVHEDLRLLLETYLPSKKKKVLLGVGDPKIGAAIQEELGYNCQTGGVIAEILRGKSPVQCVASTMWMKYHRGQERGCWFLVSSYEWLCGF